MPARRASRAYLLDRRRSEPSFLLLSMSVIAVVAISFVTVCPIGFRPNLGHAGLERFGAYFTLGLLLILTLPRRLLTVLVFVVFLAVGLEYAQRIAPGRHAVFTEALLKAAGGVVGAITGVLGLRLQRRAPSLLELDPQTKVL